MCALLQLLVVIRRFSLLISYIMVTPTFALIVELSSLLTWNEQAGNCPPWYHARPVSARCLAWYTHNSAQHGTCSARRNEHAILLHTPKRLVLFRNGEPEVKHTLMLQRRTTYSFDVLLDRMSEVMHFPVLRLHTADGRRVRILSPNHIHFQLQYFIFNLIILLKPLNYI